MFVSVPFIITLFLFFDKSQSLSIPIHSSEGYQTLNRRQNQVPNGQNGYSMPQGGVQLNVPLQQQQGVAQFNVPFQQQQQQQGPAQFNVPTQTGTQRQMSQGNAPANKSVPNSGTANNLNQNSNANRPTMIMVYEKEENEPYEMIPNLNTIVKAMTEVYYEDKYGTQNSDPSLLVKMVGKVIGDSSRTGNPEAVAKAILDVFAAYNQSTISSSNPQSNKGNTAPVNGNQNSKPQPAQNVGGVQNGQVNGQSPSDGSNSLKTIAQALKDVHESQEHSEPKSDMSQLVRVLGQEIGTSSRSGDPKAVVSAIEVGYSNFMTQSPQMINSNPSQAGTNKPGNLSNQASSSNGQNPQAKPQQ